jgi:competence protein ComGC
MEMLIVILIVIIALFFTIYKILKIAFGKDKDGCSGCINKDKCTPQIKNKKMLDK